MRPNPQPAPLNGYTAAQLALALRGKTAAVPPRTSKGTLP